MDRINKLPIGVIENILCLLPIKEAARTSILSKEWRYHWIKIPKLTFIEKKFKVATDGAEPSVLEQTFDKPSERKEMAKGCKLFNAIYQVLLMHQGPIHEFTLCMKADGSCVEIDHIILHLSKKNTVKKLKLNLKGRYALPLSFFSLQHLTDLYLNDCAISIQPDFKGFGSLTTLHLQKVRTCKKALLWLSKNCPSLKRLNLLSDGATIHDCGGSSIADLIKCLPGIEYLSLQCFIFTCFLPLPKELPTTLFHLKSLCMEWVWLEHKYAGHFLVLLIRSSPNLEKLKLEISVYELFDESEKGPFTPKDYSDITLGHLNELEILYFTNDKNELAFVQFILAKSPVLKKVRILQWDKFDVDEKLEVSKSLSSFPCASSMIFRAANFAALKNI